MLETLQSASARARKRAGAFLVDNVWRGLATLGEVHPKARPEQHGLERIRDIAYRATGDRHHTLDVWRPAKREGLLPVVLYLHGGGFRILSKDTHWIFGIAWARPGYVVFNANYRLAPHHPYPAAIEDAAAALEWVVEHAAEFGGDPQRIVIAGESAGGNLVTSLALMSSVRLSEPWAARVFDLEPAIKAAMPACGMLQVSDPERFSRRRKLPKLIQDRIDEVSHAYLHDTSHDPTLADPLLALEGVMPMQRPLPPFFVPCGTNDPLIDDSRRLVKALQARSVPVEGEEYRGEVHAFHALYWRENAKKCWRDTHAFAARCVR